MEIGIQVSSLKPLLTTAAQVRDAFTRLSGMGYVSAQLQWIDPSVTTEEVERAIACSGLHCIGTQDRYDDVLPVLDREIERNRRWGGSTLCVSGVPQRFRSREGFGEMMAELNAAAERCAAAGLRLTFHPLAPDYDGGPGETYVDRILDGASRPIQITVDLFHLIRAGQDPVAWLRKLAGRADIVHFKDGVSTGSGEVLTPVGRGDTDWAPIVAACEETGVRYGLVEQERWDTEPFACMEASRLHLLGLLRGVNKPI